MVEWKGDWPGEQYQWVREEDLGDARSMLTAFYNRDVRVLHKQGGEGRRRKNGEKTEESETISHLPMYGYDGTSIFDQSQNQHNQTPLILTQHLHLPAFALVQTAC